MKEIKVILCIDCFDQKNVKGTFLKRFNDLTQFSPTFKDFNGLHEWLNENYPNRESIDYLTYKLFY
jgi:hypothetical protein